MSHLAKCRAPGRARAVATRYASRRARALASPSGLCLLILAALAGTPAHAAAQSDASTIPAARDFDSPERFIIELRGGPFSPDFGDNPAYDRFFGGDNGPFLGAQLHYILARVPNIVYFTIGAGFGWSSYSGRAVANPGGQEVSEETSLVLFPVAAVGSVRIDALPRYLSLPFIFTGKLGFQWTNWNTDTGARNDESGWSVGLLYGGQIALDLDTFDRAAARSLDEDWGINHSFLFFEINHFSPTEQSLAVGGTSWLLGLGFNF